MILLSLVLVVASAAALGWGIMTTTDELVWVSLTAGLLAVALVAGSVVRMRRRVVESPAPPVPAGPPVPADRPGADPASAPVTAVRAGAEAASAAPRPAEAASAGPAPAPAGSATAQVGAGPAESATAGPATAQAGARPAESATAGSAEARRERASATPGGAPAEVRAPAPTAGAWPWPARPDEGPPRSGWTGHVAPGTWTGPPARPTAPAQPTAQAQPAAQGGGPGEVVAEVLGVAADRPVGESFPEIEGEPPAEEIPVRDALRVAQLPDEVRVVDGHPRYHLDDCPTLTGADPQPIPVSAARRAGFTPCGVCGPDRTLLARSRDRRSVL